MARRKKRQKKNHQIYLGGVVLLVALIALFISVFVFVDRASKKEVNLNDCIHFTLSGFNGQGQIEAAVDMESGYEAFFDTVKVEFSKETGLTNGDEINVSYSYDEKLEKSYNLRVIAQDNSIIVSELKDPVFLTKDELFEGIELRYEGIAPLVTAALDVENKFKDCVTYEVVDAKEYYNVGDLIEVRAIYDDAILAEMNYVAEMDSELCIKEFIVENVDRYVTRTEDITDDMMASLNKEALSFFTNDKANEYGMRIFCDAGLMPVYIDKKTTFTWNAPRHISSYLCILKDDCYGEVGTSVNSVKLCYETVISQADGKACGAEVVVQFDDLVIRADGSVELNLESGYIISADRRDSHIKAVVNNDMDDDYVSIKIN